MKVEFWACVEGLLIYRLAYQRIKKRNTKFFVGSIAEMWLRSVEEELDVRLLAIDISSEIEELEGIILSK